MASVDAAESFAQKRPCGLENEAMKAVSGAALIVFVIPALLTAFNHLRTIRGHGALVGASPTLRFNVAGIWGFLIFALLGAVLSLVFLSRATQFSQAVVAYWHTGIYGMFTMAVFGAIIFIMPRLVQCEWLSAKQVSYVTHENFS